MTTPLTRMILGVQIPASNFPTTLVVTGSAGTPPPLLVARRREDGRVLEAAQVDGAWSLTLDPADYVVTMEVPTWTAGLFTIKLAPPSGSAEPALAFFGYLDDLRACGLAVWRATSTVVDPPASSVGDDPKDPWPPPPPPMARIKLDPVSADWFHGELSAAWEVIQHEQIGSERGLKFA